MKAEIAKAGFLIAGLFMIAGCSETDPLYITDRWNAPSSNSRNLLLQVAVPSDISAGRSDTTYDASLASDAVKRLRDGKTKKIQTSSATQIGNNQSGGGGGGSE
ncbi:hypothetical protein [Acetobacter oeni]|uniref:hypothetical protein n=1 Tax=Acetobacter oeni TaxID=304077 RepID=UPI0011BEF6C1|nr:hypothetical protein [Acetobacter oeni]MBB3881904.1 hypothetical protein [Acetobacter oeni]NHO17773.1 hypothetical protein [Acetobacter oeni]